jgi:predicted nucleic acid-binding protein
MERVFADTRYWMALLNSKDELHDKARKLAVVPARQKIVTSEMVLAELLNGFSARGKGLREAAAKAVSLLRRNPSVIIYPQTSEQFGAALVAYKEMADKDWSLTDCASFLIMQAAQITSALTYDGHFTQAGFKALLRD